MYHAKQIVDSVGLPTLEVYLHLRMSTNRFEKESIRRFTEILNGKLLAWGETHVIAPFRDLPTDVWSFEAVRRID